MIKTLLNIEIIRYSSNLSQENVKKRINELFEQKNNNVLGKLTGDNQFVAHDKTDVIGWNMPYLKRKAAYIKGMIKKEENETLIELKIQPNLILSFFAVSSGAFGLILVGLFISSALNSAFLLFIGLIFISLGLIYFPLNKILKNRLQRNFIDLLHLKKI